VWPDTEDAGLVVELSEEACLPANEFVTLRFERAGRRGNPGVFGKNPHAALLLRLGVERSTVDLPREGDARDLRDRRHEVDRLDMAIDNLSAWLAGPLYEDDRKGEIGQVRRRVGIDLATQLARANGYAVVGGQDDEGFVVQVEPLQLPDELSHKTVDALRLKEKSLLSLSGQPAIRLPALVPWRKPRGVHADVSEHVRAARGKKLPWLVRQQDVKKVERGTSGRFD
jgi:hypothetical protein